MTPTQTRAMYARQLAADGETLTLTRGATSVTVRGRIMMMFPGQASDRYVASITDSVGQRRPTAVLLAQDLIDGGFPVPPLKGDVVTRVADSKAFRITEPDDMTRRLAGVPIAYQLVLAG